MEKLMRKLVGKSKEFTAFALLVSGLALAGAANATDAAPTARQLLGELIAIPSTEETGRARESAELLAKHLLTAGFPEEDVQLLGPENTVGGLVARLHGSTGKRPVLLLAHLDVVPSVAEYWSSDPYKLVTRDGNLYGRGTSDNKTGAATLIANLIRMKRSLYYMTGRSPDQMHHAFRGALTTKLT